MTPDEVGYYRARAAMETEAAFEATDPRAAEIHARLAKCYMDLVESGDRESFIGAAMTGMSGKPRPTLGVAWNGMGRARTE
jgi:hypothetical protein